MKINFEKGNGLIPVIIQDQATGKVLMLGYQNREAYEKTMESRTVHFYSRSRDTLWMKGESSGNVLLVKEIFLDCDNDTLLIQAEQTGHATCHTGRESCFYQKLEKDGNWKIMEKGEDK
jgi:phosphoribosyl-AMP cyclohydrolase